MCSNSYFLFKGKSNNLNYQITSFFVGYQTRLDRLKSNLRDALGSDTELKGLSGIKARSYAIKHLNQNSILTGFEQEIIDIIKA